MNWIDGDLHRSKRGRLRKVNPAKQRQKEYFARIRAQAEEREAARNDGRRSSSRQTVILAHQPSPQPGRRGSSSGIQNQYSPGHEEAIEQLRSFFKVPARQDSHGSATHQPLEQPLRNRGSETLLAKYGEEKLKEMRLKFLADLGRDPTPDPLKRRRRPEPPPRPDPWLHAPVVRHGPGNAPSHADPRKRKLDLSVPAIGRDAVKIRVGSQQKRLGAEGSAISGWSTIRTASQARTEKTSHPARPSSQHTYRNSSRLRQRSGHSLSKTPLSSHMDRNERIRGEYTIPLVPGSIDPSSSSSPLGFSEDLPSFPYSQESTSTAFDHPTKQPISHGSEDTSEALDRYEQLLAMAQGTQKYDGYSYSASTIDSFTDNSGLNTLSSPGERNMYRDNLDKRQADRLEDGSVTNSSSSLNLTRKFGDENTSNSCFSSLVSGQIDNPTVDATELWGSGSYHHGGENTITTPDPQNHQLILSSSISSGNIANSSGNSWPKESPSLERSCEVPHQQITTHTLEADEGWRSFVFGDDSSNIIESMAFTQASRDAARALQPSRSSSLSYTKGPPEMEINSTAATGCPLYTADIGQPSDSVEPWSSSDVPSLGAIASSSIIESDAGISASHIDDISQGTPQSQNGGSQSQSIRCASILSEEPGSKVLDDQGYRHLSDAEPNNQNTTSTESVSQESPRGEPGRAHTSGSAGYVGSNSSGSLPASVDLSSAAPALAPPRSVGVKQSGVQGVEDQTRFAPPKLFMGSRSQLQERSKAPVVARAATKRRGRPRKRAVDGRADIRSIPNYSSDPIEDFEDQQPTHTSIFPALELA
ncbi:uncharacterized protein QC763_210230 [Podospora pseudopauciseta]|uniref:Uncharacterized protein n=1 Tax=Podospora pseudopauciseta TaxID=2093780 RepID=A0ABR0HQY6_9PEZI|nr:hypothetical protein QC763_210230 [Podospora pseudopauciseta]